MKKKLSLKKLIPVIIIILLTYFALSLFWNPMPKTIEFELNPESKTNFSSAHFSFFIDEVEYDTSINEVSEFIITKTGKISFSENPLIPFNPKEDLNFTADGNEKKPYNSLMNFVLEREKKLPLMLVKKKYIKQINPRFFQSEQIKALVITNEGRQMIEIIDRDDKYILMMLLDYEISTESALEILESIRYRED